MALLDAAKDQLNAALAGAQSDVGEFLMQKSRILSMPQTLTKQNLLNANAALEKKSSNLIGQGGALKAQLDAFNTMDFSSYGKLPSMLKSGGQLAASLLSLRTEMRDHVAQVAQAANSSNPSPSLVPPSVPGGQPDHAKYASAAKALAGLMVGGAAWGMWRRWGRGNK